MRTVHEGVGLSKTWFETAEKMGIEIRYETGAQRLTQAESRARRRRRRARAGRHSRRSTRKRWCSPAAASRPTRHGAGATSATPWDHAKVRGSNFNYGDGLKMALDIGAMPWGHWGGCHATPINAEAADYGVQNLTDKTNRLSYSYGVMINVEGKRWVDEGADFNSFTYAKYGGLILKQPRSLVYQIFDSKVLEPAGAALLDERAVQVRHARGAGEAAQGGP